MKASEIRVGAVARTAGLTRAATTEAKAPVAQPATLAQSLASAPPVDAERVGRIKQAIANGTFPLSPTTVADRLIALRYEWMANDEA